jgi:hypothetical protein
MRLWVRIPPGAWMSVCYDCCVLSGRGLCDVLITRPAKSFRMCFVNVCDIETSWIRRPWPTRGCCAKRRKKKAQLTSNWFHEKSDVFIKIPNVFRVLTTLRYPDNTTTIADDARQLSRTIWTASSMLRYWLAIKVLTLRRFLSLWLRDTTECFGQYRFSGDCEETQFTTLDFLTIFIQLCSYYHSTRAQVESKHNTYVISSYIYRSYTRASGFNTNSK